MSEKMWWQSEFQYLFDGKILTKDEMACLFGQIKSVIEREVKAHKEMNEKICPFLSAPEGSSIICKNGFPTEGPRVCRAWSEELCDCRRLFPTRDDRWKKVWEEFKKWFVHTKTPRFDRITLMVEMDKIEDEMGKSS